MWTNNTIDDLFVGVMRHGPQMLNNCISNDQEVENYKQLLDTESLLYPQPKTNVNIKNWLIPNEYKVLDIEKYLLDCCPESNLNRLNEELLLFKKHDMLDVLRTMKYIVDTLRKNNVVWGVGRGSSVASYILFLLGVHKIDSVKYSLPIDEFFKTKGEIYGQDIQNNAR